MDYWMTFKKSAERYQASAPTAQEALAVIKAQHEDGFELVQVVDGDGEETSVYALSRAVDSVKVGPA